MKNSRLKMFFFSTGIILAGSLFSFKAAAQKMHLVANRSEAKITVAIVPHEAYADLKVFRTDSLDQNLKKNIGFWFISDTNSENAIPIFWISDPITADLKIVLVSYPERAGWINKSKKQLTNSR
jgi:Family of unknown function (DUF6150)